ncbi:amino acid transporter [Aspergillus piperis CBS 112811]|uniref:Amino acid transporter n=1 Tax=Aspergillus piperis CBS 112811 TaxID=1448313 RepID=A0A8G1R3B1_9EURO|nr:amino acid transporter [Aspergillus piperis CBS 112811]RAH57479.1 amino acid transporter [Aspergillus piperis CBS 112811]
MYEQIDVDDRELEAQGYAPAMPRRFSLLSLFSLGFALTATWNGFGSAIGASLAQSSSSGTIWTLVIAALMNFVVSLGMAELVSAFPNSGAQYYWSYKVASPEWAPFASYMSACISTCGWWLGLASVCNFVAATILAILQICVKEYTLCPSHQWFCYVAIIWLAALLNIYATRFLPALNQYLLYFSVSTLLITILVILVCAAPNYQSSVWVFTDTTSFNTSYDKSFLFVLCLLNNTYGFMGTDAGAHMAEEIPSPSINAPKVMIYPVIIGLVTTWPFAVACMYVITDIERVVNPPSEISLVEIYLQATESEFTTILLLAAFAICLFGCAAANITGSSRQIWAASRDNCYPLSTWLAEVHPKHKMPMNAACLTAIFATLYGLIFLRSSTAFASMVSANIVFMMTSYVIPQGIAVWRGRSSVLPIRHFNLGIWGSFVNITSCVWVCFLDIVACFPIIRPVTAANMNWVSVVIFITTAYMVLAWYLWQRHVFRGPRLNTRFIQNSRSRAASLPHKHSPCGLIDQPNNETIDKDGKVD